MNTAQLLAHFDRISEAPNAVARLRRLVLDLAVRGKLVPQNPQDEPAPELLKRIGAERARLVEAGKVRKDKSFPDVRVDEAPFLLPLGWQWVRVRQVTSDRGQTTPFSDFTYIDVTSIDKEAGRIGKPHAIAAHTAPSRARKVVQTGDVLYSCVRPYLLNIAVVESDISPMPIASTAFAVLNGYGLVLPRYLWLVLRSPYMVECVEERMRGQAYPAINDSDFALLPIPLPPLAEQRRIVAKMDELMAVCDRLEVARSERESRRDRLMAVSLVRLGSPPEEDAADAIRAHAHFTLTNLPHLTARPEHIKQLRQAVLDLAVRGRLAAQALGDEISAKLLERMDAERVRLMKKGAPKPKPTSALRSNENLPDLPPGWCRVRLSDILLGDTQNGCSAKPDDAPGGCPILRISAGTARKDGFVAEEQHKLISGISAAQRELYRLEPGDLLACRFNGNRNFVGRLSLFADHLGLKPIYPDKLIRVRLMPGVVVPKLVKWFFDSTDVRRVVEGYCATTVGNWGISATNLKQVELPLPPLAEQRRIVAKVDELMALCDRLEACLATASEASRGLLEAVLRDALAPALDEAA